MRVACLTGEVRQKRVLTTSGATATMQLLIQEVPATDAPIDLLLIADPSKDKVLSYLSRSRCFVASSEPIVGVCVVQPLGEGAYELMSIAVPPSHQKCGYGTALLKWVIDFFRKSGARQIEVGTGTFGYQLAFYQRHGFRVTGIDRDLLSGTIPSRYLRTVSNCLICFVSRCGIPAVAPDNAFNPKLLRYASHKGERVR